VNLAFVLLGLAVVAAWIPAPRIGALVLPPWIALLAAAAVAGFAAGVLAPLGLVALALLAVFAAAARLAPAGRGVFTLLASAWALALALHLVPGFRNPVLVAGVRFSADALPFTVYLNFDKAAAGLVLVAAFCRPGTGAPAARSVAWTLAGALATCVVVLGLGVATGFTRLEPKWPADAPTLLAVNLLFTCVAEEAFFRGLIQARIAGLAETTGRTFWRPLAVVVAAVLFGLAHAGGGALYAGLAAVAGIGYGMTYAATRRIESAILVHFALNAVHFVGFTYPALAR